MRLVLPHCTIRSLVKDDAPSIAHHANDRAVWRNLRDVFPHPYALHDAQVWIASSSKEPSTTFAIDVDGQAVGAIGFEQSTDVYRHTAEIGYWLGSTYWGRGLGTEVVRGFGLHLFETRRLVRLQANVFHWNPASMRVLEKVGFVREACMKKAAFKDGEFVDVMLYAWTRG